MSETGNALENPLLDTRALEPELAVLGDEGTLFFLSYIYNSDVQLTYHELYHDLVGQYSDLGSVITSCLHLRDLGMLELSYTGEKDHTTAVTLSNRGRKLLRIAGFTEKVKLSVEGLAQEPEPTERMRRKKDFRRVSMPSISIRTEHIGDLAVFEVVYDPNGFSQKLDLLASLQSLFAWGTKKVVVDFYHAQDLGDAGSKVIEFLQATHDYLRSSRGRMALSSLSPSVTRALRTDPVLFSLNRYDTQEFAIEALREPPNKRSLGGGAAT